MPTARATAFRAGVTWGQIVLLVSVGIDTPHTGWAEDGWLSQRQARRLIKTVARRENRFFQPGVGYDGRTGMTFDGQNIDFKTGRPVATRNWSASSKECLHLAILVKAVAGDKTARVMVAPGADLPSALSRNAWFAFSVLALGHIGRPGPLGLPVLAKLTQ